MIFEQISVGNKRRNFSYIIADEGLRVAAAVDVGYKPELVLDRLDALKLKLKYLLATHPHRDHIGGVPTVIARTGARLVAYHTVERVDLPVKHGSTIRLGNVPIRVIHTPGHTPDSVCYLVGGKKLLTGDTLYVGSIPKAPTPSQAATFYQSVHMRLMMLDDDVVVCPGHDNGATPTSTIGHERRTNYVVRMSQDDFRRRMKDRKTRRYVVDCK